MKRTFLFLALSIAGAAYAGGFTITTNPKPVVIVNGLTGRVFTGHLASIQYTTVNGIQTVTVTVTP